mgnify:CR=1 FL=1
MAHWVSVWRAAQLVGVPRGVLQQRVRVGEIELHDGLVSTETLLTLYPQTELEHTGMLERVTHIKEDAFGRRVYVNVPVDIDEETLKAIAAHTGGRYFRATDADSTSAG